MYPSANSMLSTLLSDNLLYTEMGALPFLGTIINLKNYINTQQIALSDT